MRVNEYPIIRHDTDDMPKVWIDTEEGEIHVWGAVDIVFENPEPGGWYLEPVGLGVFTYGPFEDEVDASFFMDMSLYVSDRNHKIVYREKGQG